MKRNSFLIRTLCAFLCTIFCTFMIVSAFSCSSFLSDVKEEDEKMHKVPESLALSNFKFDSLGLVMSADTEAKDGTEISVICNEKNNTAKACGGKISWNVSSSFGKGVKGGLSYEAVFSSSDYKGEVKKSLSYWPKASYELSCEKVMTIYNGSVKNFVSPEYSINYDDACVTKNMWLEAYDSSDKKITQDTSNWKQEDMLSFLGKSENDGSRVEVHFSITPKLPDSWAGAGGSSTTGSAGAGASSGDTAGTQTAGVPSAEELASLSCEGFVTYFCKNDVLVKSAVIRQVFDRYEVFLYGANGEEAGGDISYQWERSPASSSGTSEADWTKLSDVTTKTYAVSEEDFGKKLRVKVTQNYGDRPQESIVSNEIQLLNIISDFDIYYDGTVPAGSSVDFANFKGTVTNSFGKTGTIGTGAEDFKVSKNDSMDADDYVLFSSQKIYIKITAAGYEEKNTAVFVTVQAVLDKTEIPALSKDVSKIDEGNVLFEGQNVLLEFSQDSGKNWKELPSGEFEAKAGDILLFRKKTAGTPNVRGYIKESEVVEVEVKTENIGTKLPPVKEITVQDVKFNSISLELSASTLLPDGLTITAKCNGAEHKGTVSAGSVKFNMDSSFTSGILGGYSYSVQLSAEGYRGTNITVDYWPEVTYSLNTNDEVIVYNGGVRTFVQPQLTTNYGDNLKTSTWFKLFVTEVDENTGRYKKGKEITSIDTSSWLLEDMLKFVADTSNDGKTIEVHFALVPVCEKSDLLKKEGYITYHLKKDVKVVSVVAGRFTEYYEAYLRAAEDDDSAFETAGGIVSYQWQSSSDGEAFSDIDGATKKIYHLSSLDEGKYLRVKVVQVWEGTEQAPVISEKTEKILDFIEENNLRYDTVVVQGEEIDADISNFSGNIQSFFGKTLDASELKFAKEQGQDAGYYKPAASKPVYFVLALDENPFEDKVVQTFVTVRSSFKEDQVPALSVDNRLINAGKVSFGGYHSDIEFALVPQEKLPAEFAQNPEEYLPAYSSFPEGEFDAKPGDLIFLRKKVEGNPNTEGYLKESLPAVITVKTENIGIKQDGSGIISELKKPVINLTQEKMNGMIFVKPHLEVEGSFYKYDFEWSIDGFASPIFVNGNSLVPGVTTNNKNELVINPYQLGKDVYQICCKVTVKMVIQDDEYDLLDEYDLVTVSDSISVEIE